MSKFPGFVYAGSVDVDSGTLMIGDPCYLDGGFDYSHWCSFGEYRNGNPVGTGVLPGPSDYAEPGEGGTFAAHTLRGDGSYPVYVKLTDGRVSAMLVDTDPDESDYL